MLLNERIVVPDITLALEGEEGAFLVSAPTGETLEISLDKEYVEVHCSAYLPDAKRNDELWTIVKIGELEWDHSLQQLPKASELS